jgi:outer membrane protein OmpA-like peptidoglycan-associated protein
VYFVKRPVLLTLLTACLAAPSIDAFALTLEFPGPASATASRQEAPSSYRLPTAPWALETGVPSRLATGALDQTAWRVNVAGLTTLALLQPLKDQLIKDGWTIVFECETRACGGFDFRYAIEVLPEPDMHVDLGDFRFLSAEKGNEVASLLVSKSTVSGFVQVTRLGADLPPAPRVIATTSPDATPPRITPEDKAPPVTGSLQDRLERGGSVALDDLVFASGAAELVAGDYASLQALATYLSDHPDREIALVGHTDASGGLAGNIALSKRRAESVRQVLIRQYGAKATQIIAEGVGYLAPRASNLSAEGRTQNRRVEVMITSTR